MTGHPKDPLMSRHCTPGVLPQDGFATLQGASEARQSHTME